VPVDTKERMDGEYTVSIKNLLEIELTAASPSRNFFIA
jgi:hypothetical protein